MSKFPSLRDLVAKRIAQEIERTPGDYYVKQLRTLETEYLKLIFKKLSYVSLEKFHNSGDYKDSLSHAMIKNSMKETEDYYRHLFATDRANSELADPHLMLIDVFDQKEAFDYHPGEPEENKLPRLFANPNKPTSGPAIVSQDEFYQRFSIFTEDQLKGLDWSNVFAAGGSVLASVGRAKAGCQKYEIREYFHRNDIFAASDVDLFIYGLSPENATEKLKEIFSVVRNNNPNSTLCIRTPQSVSIVSSFPYRHIQIVLRLYKSPAEILMGFDLDCVTVGFDGKKVWALPRFHRAITRQYNLVDVSRRSTSYEVRLFKYSKRGFEVAVPDLDRSKLNPAFTNPSATLPGFRQFKGLARLLAYEKNGDAPRRYWHRSQNITNSRNLELTETIGYGPKTSDYGIAFLPWGPNWSAERIGKLLYKLNNSRHYNDIHKTNYQKGNTIEEILQSDDDNQDFDDEDKMQSSSIDPSVLPPSLTWLTVDPGRQYIGSFHPEDPNTWFEDAYSKTTINSTTTAPPSFPFAFGLGGGGFGGAPLVMPPFLPLASSFNSVPVIPAKPLCMYGTSCYRKNPDHFAQFDHPWLNK